MDGWDTFLGGLEKFAIRFKIEIDIDELRSSEHLNDHPRRHNRLDSQLHQLTINKHVGR